MSRSETESRKCRDGSLHFRTPNKHQTQTNNKQKKAALICVVSFFLSFLLFSLRPRASSASFSPSTSALPAQATLTPTPTPPPSHRSRTDCIWRPDTRRRRVTQVPLRLVPRPNPSILPLNLSPPSLPSIHLRARATLLSVFCSLLRQFRDRYLSLTVPSKPVPPALFLPYFFQVSIPQALIDPFSSLRACSCLFHSIQFISIQFMFFQKFKIRLVFCGNRFGNAATKLAKAAASMPCKLSLLLIA